MSMVIMLTLSAGFALVGAALLGRVIAAAFHESLPHGLLALMVPGYAIVYAGRRM